MEKLSERSNYKQTGFYLKQVNKISETRDNLNDNSNVKMIFNLERRLPISSHISVARVHAPASVTATLPSYLLIFVLSY